MHLTNKGFVSKIHKECQQIFKKNIPSRKMGKGHKTSTGISQQRKHKWPINVKKCTISRECIIKPQWNPITHQNWEIPTTIGVSKLLQPLWKRMGHYLKHLRLIHILQPGRSTQRLDTVLNMGSTYVKVHSIIVYCEL